LFQAFSLLAGGRDFSSTAAMRAPISGQIHIQALQFSELPRFVFGERNALTRLRCIDG
jgi:hypothetical protein